MVCFNIAMGFHCRYKPSWFAVLAVILQAKIGHLFDREMGLLFPAMFLCNYTKVV